MKKLINIIKEQNNESRSNLSNITISGSNDLLFWSRKWEEKIMNETQSFIVVCCAIYIAIQVTVIQFVVTTKLGEK